MKFFGPRRRPSVAHRAYECDFCIIASRGPKRLLISTAQYSIWGGDYHVCAGHLEQGRLLGLIDPSEPVVSIVPMPEGGAADHHVLLT